MSLFQCEICGCVENTATSSQGCTGGMERLFDWTGLEDLKGKKLCSVCAPRIYRDGTSTWFGRWHGEFKRTFLPKGKFKTNRQGNLEHIETGETDYRKYAI